MVTHHRIIVIGCAAALVLAAVPFVLDAWRSEREPRPAPAHGTFASRFQPALEGIGSSRDLPPIRLDGPQQNKEARHARAGQAR